MTVESLPHTLVPEQLDDSQESRPVYEVYDVAPEVWDEVLPGVELPQGYGVIGGAARSIAFRLLRGDKPPFVRDIDLVCTVDADKRHAETLAKKYSPDDAAHDHGVQQVDDIDRYFQTRDFTLNQLMVIDGKLIMPSSAAMDIKNGVIRLTDYEHRDGWIPSDRMVLKGMLLESALNAEGHNVRIADKDERVFSERRVGDVFSLALTLQKSLEYGQDVAEEYWSKLARRGMLNDLAIEIKDAATHHNWSDLATEIGYYLNWGFQYRGSAMAYVKNSELLSEFIWSQGDDLDDEIEHWRDKLDEYTGPGSKYLRAEYGGK